MEPSNANQNFQSNDPIWVLHTELLLGDFLSDDNLSDMSTTGYLFQSLRELGMSPQCMENIISTLAALVRTKQGRLEFAGRIRIFCQKKILDDANSAKTSRLDPTEQLKKPKGIFFGSGANTIGGWGYFMIERGEDLPPDSSTIPHNDIDLYLYKEGE